MRPNRKLWRVLILAVLGLLVAPAPLLSQSCALCYTQAGSAGAHFIAALRSGILVLMVPPVVMSLGLIVVLHRRRNRFRSDVPADLFGPTPRTK